MKKFNLLVALLCAMMISACVQHEEPGYQGPYTTITVGIGETKTSLGEKKDGVCRVFNRKHCKICAAFFNGTHGIPEGINMKALNFLTKELIHGRL